MVCTYEEEGIGQEGVDKNKPAGPAAGALASIDDFGDGNGEDDADKLVARVGDEIKQLGLARDAQEVTAELEGDDFNDDDDQALGGRVAQKLGLELASESGDEGGEEDEGDESHDWGGRFVVREMRPSGFALGWGRIWTDLVCTCPGC